MILNCTVRHHITIKSAIFVHVCKNGGHFESRKHRTKINKTQYSGDGDATLCIAAANTTLNLKRMTIYTLAVLFMNAFISSRLVSIEVDTVS